MVTAIKGSAEMLVPCTCGELVQGALGGLPFLISCPVDRYSRVRVNLARGHAQPEGCGFIGTGHQACIELGKPHKESGSRAQRFGASTKGGSRAQRFGVSTKGGSRAQRLAGFGVPPNHILLSATCLDRNGKSVNASNAKAIKAAALTLDYLGLRGIHFDLEISCPLPPSKGFGTSTADVVGAITAVAEAVGRALSPIEVARLAVAVEPSDGTMFPGLALFDHRGSRRWEELGPAPPLLVVALDFEGTVDTEDYNARLDTSHLHALEYEHSRSLELLIKGLRYHQLELVGEAATISARANQRLLAKPQLEPAIALGRECRALGVCAAHSGTALGVLFAPGDIARAKLFRKRAEERLEGLSCSWIATMVGGGARMPLTSARKQ